VKEEAESFASGGPAGSVLGSTVAGDTEEQ